MNLNQLFPVLISLSLALSLSACNSSTDTTGGTEGESGAQGQGVDHPLEGSWKGTLNCSATVNDNGRVQSESGTQSFELKFDDSGDLVLVLGGEDRSLETEGQVITTQESDGSILKTTVSDRAVSNAGAAYVVDSVSDDTQADSNSNFSVHGEQRTSIDFDLDSSGSKGAVTLQIESDETTSFSSQFGGGVTQKLSELSCSGEMARN